MQHHNPVTEQARKLQKKGVAGDTHLVHMNTRELQVLAQALGRGPTKNPHTGLPSFADSESGDGTDAGNSGTGSGTSGSGTTGAANFGGDRDSSVNTGQNPGDTVGGLSGFGGEVGSQDPSKEHHAEEGLPGGFGAPTFGNDPVGTIVNNIRGFFHDFTLGKAIDTVATFSPIGVVNLGFNTLTGLSIGHVVDNMMNGLPAMTGIGQGTIGAFGFDTGVPDNAVGMAQAIGGKLGASDMGTGPATDGTSGNANSNNGDKGDPQQQQNPVTTASNGMLSVAAPFTPSTLASIFNNNTGDVFSQLNMQGAMGTAFGNSGLPGAPVFKDAFSKLQLPNIQDLSSFNQPKLPNPNKITMNIDDLAQPLLAILAQSGGV